ncbi:MAG: RadC family protein [Flammeovirgaceae bacterium]
MATSFEQCNIAEVQLTYSTKVKASERPKINSSRDSYELAKQSWNMQTIELREEMKVILLNNAHRLLGIYKVSEGGVTGTIADPKLIFAAALKSNSSAIILCHNHPSGNTQPSNADITLTKRCREIGELLDIKVLDHLIITNETYHSLADEGII